MQDWMGNPIVVGSKVIFAPWYRKDRLKELCLRAEVRSEWQIPKEMFDSFKAEYSQVMTVLQVLGRDLQLSPLEISLRSPSSTLPDEIVVVEFLRKGETFNKPIVAQDLALLD